MGGGAFAVFFFVYSVVGVFTTIARLSDGHGKDEAAISVAVGVLWAIYLPYRLILLIWARDV